MSSTTPPLRGDARLAADLDALERVAGSLAAVDPAELTGYGLGDQVVRLLTVARQLDAATSLLSERFTHTGEATADLARSSAAWLGSKVSEPVGVLRTQHTRAGFLTEHYPVVLDGWTAGRLSGRHVDVLVKIHVKFPALRAALVEVQAQVVEVAQALPPRAFEAKMREICHRMNPVAIAEAETDDQTKVYFHASPLLDGMVKVDGLLPADIGAALINALDSARAAVRGQATTPDSVEGEAAQDALPGLDADPRAGEQGPWDGRTVGYDNVAAVKRILTAAIAATGQDRLPDIGGERPTIHATIPLAALLTDLEEPTDPAVPSSAPAATGASTGLPIVQRWAASTQPAWLERRGGLPYAVLSTLAAQILACDSSIEPVFVDAQGRVRIAAERSRTIPWYLRRAIITRDRHCRFPGCKYAIDEIHHIIYFSRGGKTISTNLIGLCWHHHHQIHRLNWQVLGDPNGPLDFTNSTDRTYTSHPATALAA